MLAGIGSEERISPPWDASIGRRATPTIVRDAGRASLAGGCRADFASDPKGEAGARHGSFSSI
jgi:hypothetical protein